MGTDPFPAISGEGVCSALCTHPKAIEVKGDNIEVNGFTLMYASQRGWERKKKARKLQGVGEQTLGEVWKCRVKNINSGA